MKRYRIIVPLVLLIGLLAPTLHVLATPDKIPHEDPALARTTLDSGILLSAYGTLFQTAADRKYTEARTILDDLKGANIPDELQYLFNRYNNLTQDLLTGLDRLEQMLDQASVLLAHNQLEDAKSVLDEASNQIQGSDALFQDLRSATDTMFSLLAIGAITGVNPTAQAYERLMQAIQRLRQLLQDFNALYEQLMNRHRDEQSTLAETEIALSLDRNETFVGDRIVVSGTLTSEGKVLPKRNITVFLDDHSGHAVPGPDGYFEMSFRIPYRYV